MTFNEKIDKFMKDNGYSNIKKLAIDSGIPYTTLNDFYNKKSANNSRFSTIRKLSKFMKCSMDYLAYDDLLDPNEIKIDGLDIDEEYQLNNNLEQDYKIDDFDIFYKKVKKFLTEQDKEYIKLIMKNRMKEIDEEDKNK